MDVRESIISQSQRESEGGSFLNWLNLHRPLRLSGRQCLTGTRRITIFSNLEAVMLLTGRFVPSTGKQPLIPCLLSARLRASSPHSFNSFTCYPLFSCNLWLNVMFHVSFRVKVPCFALLRMHPIRLYKSDEHSVRNAVECLHACLHSYLL